MGREPKWTDDEFLDAAMQLVASGGLSAATMTAVAAKVGAPSGSLYHRFTSRNLILARLWIRTIKEFQAGYVAALQIEDTDAATEAAVAHILAWGRTHRQETQLMLHYRREDLAAEWPDELGDELAGLNKSVTSAIRSYAKRRYGRVTKSLISLTIFALVDIPYAAMRRHLQGSPRTSGELDRPTLTATRSVLASRTERP